MYSCAFDNANTDFWGGFSNFSVTDNESTLLYQFTVKMKIKLDIWPFLTSFSDFVSTLLT